MSYFRSGDPLADFDRYEREQEKRLEQLPVCDYCGEPIQDDFFYQINGENYCPDCMEGHFRMENDLS